MSPANSYCTRLLSSVAPSAPVRSEAPTTATDLGRSNRSICWLVKRRSVMPCSPNCAAAVAAQPGGSIPLDLALVEHAEAGLEGLVVEELLGGFPARSHPAELVERFLGADQVLL